MEIAIGVGLAWMWFVGALLAGGFLAGLLDGWARAAGVACWPIAVPAVVVYILAMMGDAPPREQQEWVAAGRDPYTT
jgi:hypothetical protein